MKIVVLDGHTNIANGVDISRLESLGELVFYDRTPYEEDLDTVIARIGGAPYIFTNKTPITKQVFDVCPNIEYIGEMATGYNNVDIVEAKRRGVVVTNIPAYGTDAVGQHAIAMLLEITNRVGYHDAAVHAGRWCDSLDFCFWDYSLIELKNKVMGIIGFGRIGQVTGRIARALGMKVIACDEYRNDEGREIGEYVSLDELLERSDVISLHCPLFENTKGIINKVTIEKMKDGVIILNNSRGPLIIERDLADALHSGKVLAAGLDVVSHEPIERDNPLLYAPNCIITPHTSWAPRETRQRLMDIAIENFVCYLNGSPVNVVSK